MTVILVFYVIGGVVGVLINLRFMLPTAYFDLTNAWGFLGVLKNLGYHFARILILSCVAFFVSWISVGYFVIYYDDLKSEIEDMKF